MDGSLHNRQKRRSNRGREWTPERVGIPHTLVGEPQFAGGIPVLSDGVLAALQVVGVRDESLIEHGVAVDGMRHGFPCLIVVVHASTHSAVSSHKPFARQIQLMSIPKRSFSNIL